MRNLNKFVASGVVLMVLLLGTVGGQVFAANGAQKGHGFRMTPELAAKREMVRKQQEQRITPEKRKAAVDTLKAERLRIYRAKQAMHRSRLNTIENN